MTDDDETESLRKAVLNDPRNGELRYLLAAEMAQQQDYESAVLEFSAALALNPLLHIARLQLGLLHLTLAQAHHAIEVLGPLEDLDDTSALKHFKRGLEALIADDFEACVKHMKAGIELNRENVPLNRDMSLIVQKASTALDQARNRSSPQQDADERSVRTDFSLYGVTKH